jgi:hypothetical protein
MTKADGGQQGNNQPMKGSGNVGSGGGGNSNSGISSNNSNTMVQRQCNGNGDGQQWTVQQQCNGNNGDGRRKGDATATRWQRNGDGRRNSNINNWSNGNAMSMMAMGGTLATARAIDGTMVTVMEGAMATRRQRR